MLKRIETANNKASPTAHSSTDSLNLSLRIQDLQKVSETSDDLIGTCLPLAGETEIDLGTVGMFHFAAHAEHVEPAREHEGRKHPPEKPGLLHKKDHSLLLQGND